MSLAGRLASLAGRPGLFVDAVAVLLSIWEIVALTLVAVDAWLLRFTHLTLVAIIAARTMVRGTARRPGLAGRFTRLWSWALVAMALTTSIYLIADEGGIQFRAGVAPTTADIIVGVMTIVMVMDLLRRTTGWALPILISIFICYALLGHLLPGILWNRGYSAQRLVSYLFGTEGIYGIPLGASATYVFLFVLFGAFLQKSKAGDLFIQLASAAVGTVRGGPAKMAVLASAMFGTISGSAVSNVVVSGSLTIPMMKRHRYPPAFAGAVEAVASSGGQLMPPVMGAAAFLMADIAGIPYADIALAGLLPAIVYFASLFWIIDLESGRHRYGGLSAQEVTPLTVALRQAHLLIPLLTVLYFLLIERTSPILAGTWGTVACVLAASLRAGTRFGLTGVLEALATAGRGIVDVSITCAGAGILIGVLSLTGLGLKIANSLIAFSGDSTFVALLISAFVALILGIGMPTSAAYVISAIVLAPALVNLGIPLLAAHMFVFYFACISTITPPVALAAYAAAPIADADPMRVGFTAFKLGMVSFLVPFGFVYGPGLLFIGPWYSVLLACVSALIGAAALGTALAGWLPGGKLGWPARAAAFAGALLMIWQGLLTDLAGMALFAAVVVPRIILIRQIAPVSQPVGGQMTSVRETNQQKGI